MPLATLYENLILTPYGTHRGLVRLWLAQLEAAVGRLERFRNIDFGRVERLVFVCLGNVCRSPYGHLLAEEAGLPCASFGLSTTTGAPAYPAAVQTATRLGRDLNAHRATDWGDFDLRDGDLLLAMEVRQAHALAARTAGRDVQIALLGFWADPARPHIHDPMTLSDAYFETCYRVIDSAVARLGRELLSARAA